MKQWGRNWRKTVFLLKKKLGFVEKKLYKNCKPF